MSIPVLPGITAKTITTERITTRVLFFGSEDGNPVLFLHGNLAAATWWEEVLLTLPAGFRGIAPDQRGFGLSDPHKKIDATRGLRDWADDAVALLDYLNLEKAHIVGSSAGGSAVWQMMLDYPERFLSATVVDPGSPYGFGGTRDTAGTPCYDDFAGSGGGLVNPQFVQQMCDGVRTLDNPFSPRTVMRTLLFKFPFIPEREEALLTAMLSIHLGQQDYPGDSESSPNWPYVAPGKWGLVNALSPKFAPDVAALYALQPKIDLLWIHGSDDILVSNHAAPDPATVGQAGLLPNWPGAEIYPPQPMIDQTRAVLENYAAAGGRYHEVVIQDTGHMPHIEKPSQFNAVFHQHIESVMERAIL
ncbi:MAG: alpha/beta hydrolase [Anaerolineae bacterium]|nr:alpha/beta hydrolase [Anaerolineae bacterium]